MKFIETNLRGLWVLEMEKREDARGWFARTWCENEFRDRGLNARLVQCSTSFNHKAGTLRGMHWQAAPHGEAKLIRCTRGAIYDVAVDLREESPTYKQSFAIELRPDEPQLLYIPEGFAHGFQTLEDESEVLYQMSEFFHPESARGARWNDPAFGIIWPDAIRRIISDRDAAYPDFV